MSYIRRCYIPQFIPWLTKEDRLHSSIYKLRSLIITKERFTVSYDPFHNNGYKWYVSQGGQHSPKHKDEMHIRYRFPILTYTSL
jgi:hypothetical protein